MAKKEKSGFVFTKNNYYYIRLIYYVEKNRKQKDVATGIQVGNPDSRAGKKPSERRT